MTIIGIDPSVARTGIAIRRDGELTWTLIDMRPRKRGEKAMADPGRLVAICDEAVRFLALLSGEEVLLVIEACNDVRGYNRVNIGLHWMLRAWLADNAQVQTLSVATTSLKKFVTDDGKAEKGTMGAHIARRWGDELDEAAPEDVLEAFALLKFGECWLATVGENVEAGLEVGQQGEPEEGLFAPPGAAMDEWLDFQREVVRRGAKVKGQRQVRVAELDTASLVAA